MGPAIVNDNLSIAGQPSPADFAGIAAAGFATVINSRPDGEEEGQPGSAAEASSADEAGLVYAHIPITLDNIKESDVRAFQAALASANGPVFAHCKSGARALTLFVLGEVLDGRMRADDVREFGEAHGHNLAAADTWLAGVDSSHEYRRVRPNSARPDVKGFYDPRTFSIQYVVTDPATKICAIVDPVLDFDERSGSTATTNADAILTYVRETELTVAWILDTHPHADHFSAAQYLKEKTAAPTAIGERVVAVQRVWKDLYHWPKFAADGSQWDKLFANGDRFKLGTLDVP